VDTTKLLGEASAVRHAAAVNHRCEAIIRISHNLANAISFTSITTVFVRTSVCSRRIGELYLNAYACLSKPIIFYCQQNYNCSAPLLAFPSTIIQRNAIPMNNSCSRSAPKSSLNKGTENAGMSRTEQLGSSNGTVLTQRHHRGRGSMIQLNDDKGVKIKEVSTKMVCEPDIGTETASLKDILSRLFRWEFRDLTAEFTGVAKDKVQLIFNYESVANQVLLEAAMNDFVHGICTPDDIGFQVVCSGSQPRGNDDEGECCRDLYREPWLAPNASLQQIPLYPTAR
jgi:hypothetical protein